MGRDGTPSGQACTADSGQAKKTKPNNRFDKIIVIGRLGQSAEAKTTQNDREYLVLNIATQQSWRNDKGDYENRAERHRVYAWRNLSNFAKTLQKGQLVTLEGILRYREVESEVKGTTFKRRIAEVHATSRGQRLEATWRILLCVLEKEDAQVAFAASGYTSFLSRDGMRGGHGFASWGNYGGNSTKEMSSAN